MRIGLDFGTTNSGAAVFDGQRVYAFSLDSASRDPGVIRSVLYITRDHEVFIGQEAVDVYYRQNVGRPSRMVRQYVGEVEFTMGDVGSVKGYPVGPATFVKEVHILVDELTPGRMLRSLKSALSSDHTGTDIFGRVYKLEELIAIYLRELRDQIETLGRILVPAPDGSQIPITQLATINYVRGPQVIKSEDTFLVGYVLFDMKPGNAEVDVVEQADRYLKYKIETGDLVIPAGVSYTFAGSYENQQRAQRTLSWVLPLALFLIFVILYLQFKSAANTWLVFSGIIVAWAGGFLMLWLYGQAWFADFTVFGTNMRDLFSIRPYNLSIAVWVGFLALFGIATDDGVLFCTYLDQIFKGRNMQSVAEIRRATVEAGMKRIRPALMTAGTTILALIPVLTSTGKGAEVMVPMALPSFGGMTVALITVFVAPTLYCLVKEMQFRARSQ